MKLAIQIEAMFGYTWDSWKHQVSEIERLGFAGVFRSDHFAMADPPDLDSLEAIVSLTYLAHNSQSIHFGTLVAPLSWRDPVMLARQAMALDDLSGGRMVLGVGAGWAELEHGMFGYHLGDVTTRMDRLAEGLEVITRLIRSDEPVTFDGRFYQLRNAMLLPRPQRLTPVLVGGSGPKRTLPLVARYADIWNYPMASIDLFAERSALLDELLLQEGRQPDDVMRTVMLPVLCWRDSAERERRLQALRSMPYFADTAVDEIVNWMRNSSAIMGTPEQAIEQIRAYGAAGVEEIMLQWVFPDDTEGLELLAEHVLPYVAG
jgi:alkanesulfonate monooxygenase SsuD/methylene tetrahydromethanopterin reductase-like flavin-dependent oxidoreductase (luciferase family)